VRRAETARAAHDEIERNTIVPSLILVSANLPDEPGFQLVKRLRQRPALQNTLIYLLTNDRKTADRISIEPHGSTVVPKTEKAIRELVEDLRHLTHAPQKGTAHGTHSVG
jgi:DNA-binding response OmpR family regulator